MIYESYGTKLNLTILKLLEKVEILHELKLCIEAIQHISLSTSLQLSKNQ